MAGVPTRVEVTETAGRFAIVGGAVEVPETGAVQRAGWKIWW